MATPLRLLMLEDKHADAELILHALRSADYEPISDQVETEQDYLDCLQSTPEIILADFSMPEFDALRAIEILQERRLDIPIIVVSGSIGEEQAVQLMQRGAADYIIKDRLGRLGQAVTRALEQKRLREAKLRADQALHESEERSRIVQEAQQREKEARKQAEQDNRIKDQFLATLSHELRTPLTPMLGWSRMLLGGKLDEQSRILGLTVIDRNVKLMCTIVEDVLDISQIITGKLILKSVSVDTNRITEAAIEAIRPDADNKKIQIERTFPQASTLKPLS